MTDYAHYILLTDSKIGRREIRVDLWLPQTVDFNRALESKVDAILEMGIDDVIRCSISCNGKELSKYQLQDFPWYRIQINDNSVLAKTWEDIIDGEQLPIRLCSVGHEVFDDAMKEVLMQNGEFANGISMFREFGKQVEKTCPRTTEDAYNSIPDTLYRNAQKHAEYLIVDSRPLLKEIVDGKVSDDSAFLKKALNYLEENGFDPDGWVIMSVCDDTEVGAEEASSWLIHFVHGGETEEEYKELDINVEKKKGKYKAFPSRGKNLPLSEAYVGWWS